VNLVGIAAGDLNGDKRPDLVVTAVGEPNGAYILLGNGDGTFQNPVLLPAGIAPFAAIIGDFNSDGKPDVAVVNDGASALQNDVSLLPGNGDGTFAGAIQLESHLVSRRGLERRRSAGLRGRG
jgi:hypothetical protein